VHTIGPSESFLAQICDFFYENWFSPETRTIGTSFWGNPRSDSPWKRAILGIGLTLFLGSDSCPPDAHTNTHDNHSYLVRNSCQIHRIGKLDNADSVMRERRKSKLPPAPDIRADVKLTWVFATVSRQWNCLRQRRPHWLWPGYRTKTLAAFKARGTQRILVFQVSEPLHLMQLLKEHFLMRSSSPVVKLSPQLSHQNPTQAIQILLFC
jgi:hypothetical protein